mmetsp:Transcript_8928/g.17981  ORF Transcript_8928/g.17981 Transcript_8928/m.17981 type:complete len:394 (-) Transcript_8928:4171-5352(-)
MRRRRIHQVLVTNLPLLLLHHHRQVVQLDERGAQRDRPEAQHRQCGAPLVLDARGRPPALRDLARRELCERREKHVPLLVLAQAETRQKEAEQVAGLQQHVRLHRVDGDAEGVPQLRREDGRREGRRQHRVLGHPEEGVHRRADEGVEGERVALRLRDHISPVQVEHQCVPRPREVLPLARRRLVHQGLAVESLRLRLELDLLTPPLQLKGGEMRGAEAPAAVAARLVRHLVDLLPLGGGERDELACETVNRLGEAEDHVAPRDRRSLAAEGAEQRREERRKERVEERRVGEDHEHRDGPAHPDEREAEEVRAHEAQRLEGGLLLRRVVRHPSAGLVIVLEGHPLKAVAQARDHLVLVGQAAQVVVPAEEAAAATRRVVPQRLGRPHQLPDEH